MILRFSWLIVLFVLAVGGTIVRASIWGDLWQWFIEDPLSAIVIILTAIFVFQQAKKWMRYMYARLASKRLVSMIFGQALDPSATNRPPPPETSLRVVFIQTD